MAKNFVPMNGDDLVLHIVDHMNAKLEEKANQLPRWAYICEETLQYIFPYGGECIAGEDFNTFCYRIYAVQYKGGEFYLATVYVPLQEDDAGVWQAARYHAYLMDDNMLPKHVLTAFQEEKRDEEQFRLHIHR